MKKSILFILVFVFLISGITQGQNLNSLFPGTIESRDYNPALLGVSDYSFEFQVNPLAVEVWNNAWTPYFVLDNINEYWDENTKEEIIGSISGDAFSLGTNFNISNFYLGGGSWSINSGIRGDVVSYLDKELLQFVLHGYDSPDFILPLENTGLKSSTMLNTGISKSFNLGGISENLGWNNIYWGAGINHLLGLSHVQADFEGEAEMIFDDEETSLKGNGRLKGLYTHLLEEQSHGFALDFGLWGQPTEKLGLGLSVTNIGRMKWEGVYEEVHEGHFRIDHPLTLVDDFDELEELEEEDYLDYDFEQAEKSEGGTLTQRTPISVAGNIHYSLNPRLQFSGLIGYNEAPVPNTKFAAGTRILFPSFLPITIIGSYDTYRKQPSITAALGFHLWGWEVINISVSDLQLISGNSKNASVSISTAIRF